MHATKLRQISNERWLELQAHRQAEVLYEAQHKAIADALQGKGLRMLKVMGRPVFKISDKSTSQSITSLGSGLVRLRSTRN